MGEGTHKGRQRARTLGPPGEGARTSECTGSRATGGGSADTGAHKHRERECGRQSRSETGRGGTAMVVEVVDGNPSHRAGTGNDARRAGRQIGGKRRTGGGRAWWRQGRARRRWRWQHEILVACRRPGVEERPNT